MHSFNKLTHIIATEGDNMARSDVENTAAMSGGVQEIRPRTSSTQQPDHTTLPCTSHIFLFALLTSFVSPNYP
jgi:hypothetical protein